MKKIQVAVASGQQYPEYSAAVNGGKFVFSEMKGNNEKENQVARVYGLFQLADKLWEAEWFKNEAGLTTHAAQVCEVLKAVPANQLGPELAVLVPKVQETCQPGYFTGLYPQGIETPNRPEKETRELVLADTRRLLWGIGTLWILEFEKQMK
jgi:hypothetical protein